MPKLKGGILSGVQFDCVCLFGFSSVVCVCPSFVYPNQCAYVYPDIG